MAYGLKASSCDPLILRDSFAKTKKLTYDWQFRALGQTTSSELTWLIQLLFPTIATRWCPRRSWWRQKWIINMWLTVGPLVSVHSVRCSLSDPNSFSDKTWPVITLLTKDFGILPPIDHMVILNGVVSNSWSRLFTFRLFSGLPCKISSRGFHLFSLFLVFIQPSAKVPPRFSNLSWIAVRTW